MQPHLPARRIYGLLGRHLSHSFSARYFGQKFEQLGLAAEYRLIERAELGGLRSLAQAHPGLCGLNVTIPYKREVVAQLDALAPEAAATGAVNCIVIGADGHWVGHNTDVVGFAQALDELLAGAPCPDALVLGTGGAAAAVHHVLSQRPERPQALAVSRAGGGLALPYAALTAELLARHRLIVNATPVGMHPHTEAAPPLPYGALGPEHYLLDLIYNPAETEFLRRGQQQGAHTLNGLSMLYAQAEAGWALWQADWAARQAQPGAPAE